MVWDLKKRLRDDTAISGENKKLRDLKKSHKNEKLNLATFKLIGQKLHACGPETTKNKQINSNKDINCYYLCLLGALHPFSVPMLRAL